MTKALLKNFQHSWSQNKYWVMSRSQQAYNEIRLLAKNNEWSLAKDARYKEILAELEGKEPTVKTLTVAYQHIWGYFKKSANQAERETYQQLMALLASDPADDQLPSFLKSLAEKYQVEYLLEMRWPGE
ncbi:YbgA family protein [Enterococcus sp. HY326]|uniref:YbgA family protein n=1 Tax=Enterococcus sp. HY326 TaxID=2971265 RepID=UPI00223F5C3E|nr:YbgA family protein [Enterococcus sp. HY326]